jgi:hypothetical protein
MSVSCHERKSGDYSNNSSARPSGVRGVLIYCSDCRRNLAHYLSVKIYSARFATSSRLRDSFGMFGCGSSKRSASLFAPKSGLLAIEANGGA